MLGLYLIAINAIDTTMVIATKFARDAKSLDIEQKFVGILTPQKVIRSPENCYNCGIFRHFVRDCPLGAQDTDQKQKGVITIKDEINHQDHKEYQWIDSRQVKALEARIRELQKIIVSQAQASNSGTKRSWFMTE